MIVSGIRALVLAGSAAMIWVNYSPRFGPPEEDRCVQQCEGCVYYCMGARPPSSFRTEQNHTAPHHEEPKLDGVPDLLRQAADNVSHKQLVLARTNASMAIEKINTALGVKGDQPKKR